MKKTGVFFIAFFSFICFVFADNLKITSNYVYLYNLNDNNLIYGKNEDERVSIASITKVVTTIVALENIDDIKEFVTIKDEYFNGTVGYSKAGFKVGDKVTYEDLLYGIILPSGAEAVNAVVYTLGYDDFIDKMNEFAILAGALNTSFSNPIGKDDEFNYSTASDVAKILNKALENEEFFKIFTTKEYKTTNGITLKSTVSSYDNILNTSLIMGAKSGFTKDAGRCLASISDIDGVKYLLVVLNSSQDKPYNAVKDTIEILDYYRLNYSYQEILNDETFIKSIPVDLSKTKTYKITGSEVINKYLKNDTEVSYVYDGVDKIKFKTKKGTKLGTLSIYDHDTLLSVSDVYLESDINYYPLKTIALVSLVLLIILVKGIKYGKNKTYRHNR